MSTHRDIRRVSLIVAVGQNGEIGRGGDLLWHLPGDLQYFKRTTMDHPLIMGSRTFRSIGRALPGRISIVVSRDPDYRRTIDSLDACRGVPSVEAALEYVGTLSQDQLPSPHHPFIAGGGQIYRECLEKGLVDEVYLTLVHARYRMPIRSSRSNTWTPGRKSPGNPTRVPTAHPRLSTICG